MEETEEERIDREFDDLNAGIRAHYIFSYFEKRHPDPLGDDYVIEVDGLEDDEIWAPEAAVEALLDWTDKLEYYVQGWEDALAHLLYKQAMIKETAISDTRWEYILLLSVDNPQMFWQYHQTDIEGYLMRQVAIGFEEEEM